MNLGSLAQHIRGEVLGDPSFEIGNVASIFEAKKGDLSFLMNPKFLPQAVASEASAWITVVPIDNNKPQIIVRNPKKALGQVLAALFPNYQGFTFEGTEPCTIHASARVHETAVVGPGTVLEEGVVLMPHVVVGKNCRIGAHTVLYPSVIVYDHSDLGRHVSVHSGTIIGADGFGYYPDGEQWQRIYQIGRVVIEDNVEIGTNVCIDRGCLGETRIGTGTKIDNLVHIAHNVKIGRHCVIVSQSGFVGSAELGDHVMVGGQAGVDAIKVKDRTVIGARAGVTKTHPEGAILSGFPAWDHRLETEKEIWVRRQYKATRKGKKG